MDLKGKKLLILCGNVVHLKVVEAAKEMGVYTIVTDNLSIEDAPAKKIADQPLFINIYDTDAIIEYCKENKVDGVLNFCNDPAQHPHRIICEALGFPCFGGEQIYKALTDKTEFKKACKKYGVDTIFEYFEEDIEKDIIEYPVFVKPADSRGSRGQAVCYDKESLLKAVEIAKKESSINVAIIEKYMLGKQDFTVSYVFKDGEGYLTRTADRYLGDPKYGLQKQCIASIAPSVHTKTYLENVHDKVVDMVRSTGMTNGLCFMQGFVDGDTVRFYDPGIRLAGGEYERLLLQATGISVMKEIIKYSLGEKIDDLGGRLKTAYQLDGKVSMQLLVSVREGTISKICGLEEVRAHKDVVFVTQRYFEGDKISRTGDVRQRIAEIAVLVDAKDAVSMVEFIQSKIDVLDENGESMFVSKYDEVLANLRKR